MWLRDYQWPVFVHIVGVVVYDGLMLHPCTSQSHGHSAARTRRSCWTLSARHDCRRSTRGRLNGWMVGRSALYSTGYMHLLRNEPGKGRGGCSQTFIDQVIIFTDVVCNASLRLLAFQRHLIICSTSLHKFIHQLPRLPQLDQLSLQGFMMLLLGIMCTTVIGSLVIYLLT